MADELQRFPITSWIWYILFVVFRTQQRTGSKASFWLMCKPTSAASLCPLCFLDCLDIFVPVAWTAMVQHPPLAISPQLFHSKLKTLLFSKSYPDSSSSSYSFPPISTPNTIHHSHLTLWILAPCLSIFFWLSAFGSRDFPFMGTVEI